MNIKTLFTIYLLLLFTNSLFAQKETIKELHSDGDGWGVYEVQEEGDKTILLIGNSIYNGFKGHLAEELPGCRIVAWINPYYLGQKYWEEDLVNVLQREKYDLIHFNIGLHGYPEGRVPEGQYQSLLQHFVDLLKSHSPGSKIIWSSTTPITSKEKPYITYDELNSIIVDRNQIAAIVMKNNHIPVNDLYTLCLLNMEKARGDRFHWKDTMYRMIAIQTASKINEELNCEAGH